MIHADCGAWHEDIVKSGRSRGAMGLQPVSTATTLGERHGKVIITDGPFAESKEAVGGYLVLDVETIEEAIAIAQSSPGLAYGGSIEVRPVAEECPLDIRARELAREEQLVNV